MIALVLLLVVGCVVAVVVVRRRRQRALSGTRADRPVFGVEPPRRRMHPGKLERL